MPGRQPVHRTDTNEGDLVRAFEHLGCRLHKIHRPLDYLVAVPTTRHGWVTVVVEFKDLKTKVRPGQQRFMDTWPGLSWLVRTPADVDHLVSLVRFA